RLELAQDALHRPAASVEIALDQLERGSQALLEDHLLTAYGRELRALELQPQVQLEVHGLLRSEQRFDLGIEAAQRHHAGELALQRAPEVVRRRFGGRRRLPLQVFRQAQRQAVEVTLHRLEAQEQPLDVG